jgi:hypothetical protein
MWYLAACWNPNPRMCSQVRRVVKNFIWGGKATPSRAEVKWDTLTLPIAKGGLGIIDAPPSSLGDPKRVQRVGFAEMVRNLVPLPASNTKRGRGVVFEASGLD